MLCVIGNVGTLRGNLTLIPGASPDDGLLDLYIASPRRFRHWVKLGYGSSPDAPIQCLPRGDEVCRRADLVL
jgi:hypothetical protein